MMTFKNLRYGLSSSVVLAASLFSADESPNDFGKNH